MTKPYVSRKLSALQMFHKNFPRENEYGSVKQARGGVDSEAGGTLLMGTLLSGILSTILYWPFYLLNK